MNFKNTCTSQTEHVKYRSNFKFANSKEKKNGI